MNRAQFEKQYADESGCSVGYLHTHGRFAIPCGCKEPLCQGWQMLHTNHLDAIDKSMLGVVSSHTALDVRVALLRWVQRHTIERRGGFSAVDGEQALVSDNEAVEELFDALVTLSSDGVRCCVCAGVLFRHGAPYCSDSRHPRCEAHKYPCRINDECGVDHAMFCCRVHETHTEPHKGCNLR